MKRAVILHAMGQNSKGHWYPWLKAELGRRGYRVWVPNLPTADHPDPTKMTEFLLARKDWDWEDNLVIGHSSGAVEMLHLLPRLSHTVRAAVLLGSFDRVLWQEDHDLLFAEPLDFTAAKPKAERWLVVHGDNDPWCPVEGAAHIADEVDAEMVIVHGAGHFSTSLDPAFIENPQLLTILEERNLI